jgi:membrane protein implicated in regulation of membrane protease activity
LAGLPIFALRDFCMLSALQNVDLQSGGVMAWWGWLVFGVGLLAAEMFIIDAQFYLVFVGIAAAVVGVLGLMGVPTPEWGQWLVFTGLSLASVLAFRRPLYEMVRKRSGHVEQRLTLGDRVTVSARLEPGETCRVDYRGSSWSARNVDQAPIEAGKEAVIDRVDGLTLHIKAG